MTIRLEGDSCEARKLDTCARDLSEVHCRENGLTQPGTVQPVRHAPRLILPPVFTRTFSLNATMSNTCTVKSWIINKKPTGEITDEVGSPTVRTRSPLFVSNADPLSPLPCSRHQTFKLVETEVPELKDGQIKIKALYLSNDPAQ